MHHSETLIIRLTRSLLQIDAVIASAYQGNPQDGEGPEAEIAIVEDAIRAHIAATDATLDEDLFEASVTDCHMFSKIATALGSLTIDEDDRELFEANADLLISSTTAGKPKGVTAEQLSKVWHIPYAAAEKTLKVTSQLHRGNVNSSLSRNLGTNDRMLRYKRIKSWFYTDTFFVTKAAKSTRNFRAMQLYVSDKGFLKVYPMESERDFPKTLRMFAKDVGAPEILVADPHPVHKSKETRDFCNKIGTTLRILEQSTQWANRAELYVGLLKEAVRKDLRDSGAPLVLWDYCAERRAAIFTLTARDLFQLQGTNPYTATLGEEGDISNLCQFDWYEWVYYYDDSKKTSAFPLPKAQLGRCLGPARNEGNEMTQWILRTNGEIVPRRTINKLTAAQLAPSNEVEVRKRAIFDAEIRRIHGDSFTLPKAKPKSVTGEAEQPNHSDFYSHDFLPYEDDEETPVDVPEADCVDAAGKPILQQSVTDTIIQTEVLLPQGEDMHLANKVIG